MECHGAHPPTPGEKTPSGFTLSTFSVGLTFSFFFFFFFLEGRGLHTLDDNHLLYTLQIFSSSLPVALYLCLQWSFPYRSPHKEPSGQGQCLAGSWRNSYPLISWESLHLPSISQLLWRPISTFLRFTESLNQRPVFQGWFLRTATIAGLGSSFRSTQGLFLLASTTGKDRKEGEGEGEGKGQREGVERGEEGKGRGGGREGGRQAG